MILLEQSYTLDTISEAASRFWEVARHYRIITFSGEMGAGKTTFISTLCTQLGVEDAVSSPTFALVNEYRFTTDGSAETIYHIDFYRLKNAEEAINAGMEDCIDQAKRGDAYCFIEWPEKAAELLRLPHLSVSITTTGMEERAMTVTAANQREVPQS